MDDLQAVVAGAADAAGAHSNAPALLLQLMSALGRLSDTTNTATEGGRRPFRIPHEWADELSQLAYLVYLLADQTAVDLDVSVRSIAATVTAEAAGARAAARREDGWS
jgi:hypothetical protein